MDLLFDGRGLRARRDDAAGASRRGRRRAFWTIIRRWAASKSGGNATTPEFIALAEQLSGQQLDELFTTWLFTPEKPVLAPAPAQNRPAQPTQQAREGAATWLGELQRRLQRGRY